MASARYERLPTAPNSYSNDSDEEPPETGGQRSDIRELHRMLHADPRFNPPPPAAWKRVALVLGVLFLFWLGFTMRRALLTPLYPPEVIHADRYVNCNKVYARITQVLNVLDINDHLT